MEKQQKTSEEQTKRSHQPTSTRNKGTRQRAISIYIKYSPKKEIAELKEALISRESFLKRAYAQEETFLAHILQHIKWLYIRTVEKKQARDETK
jgi:hypothetical protein